MYQPKKYRNNSSKFLNAFVQNHPFATVVIKGDKLLATHIPILIDDDPTILRLYGHIANHNPMYAHIKDGAEMLLIFKGADSYISSSWYAEPEIPTWDYEAVHINARIKVQSDLELTHSLEKLIRHFEKDMKDPLQPNDIPHKIWNENFKEITGFWLEPMECLGVQKLHQGFDALDIHNIAINLKNGNTCPRFHLADKIKEKNNQ